MYGCYPLMPALLSLRLCTCYISLYGHATTSIYIRESENWEGLDSTLVNCRSSSFFYLYTYMSSLHTCSINDWLCLQTMAGQNGAAIKSQLLRAWRERWSDLQWSVNVKKVIPPGYTADSCQLPGKRQLSLMFLFPTTSLQDVCCVPIRFLSLSCFRRIEK